MSIGRIETIDGVKRYVKYADTFPENFAPYSLAEPSSFGGLSVKATAVGNELKWEDPGNVYLGEYILAQWAGTKVVRVDGIVNPPNDIRSVTDGVLILDNKVRNKYKGNAFLDTTADPEKQYTYKIFPYTTSGMYTNSIFNMGFSRGTDYEYYAFTINHAEEDPATKITYTTGFLNANYSPAKMNFSTGVFDYGGWADAFFMQVKPCMLKYDGTVDYYLNPNDYSKKEDGTPSDIANDAYEGNAMIQFPKVYWKIHDNGDGTSTVMFANRAAGDTEMKCWSHIDNHGDEIPYCYMPAYFGTGVSGKLRSLSGRSVFTGNSAQTEVNYAKANNLTSDVMWYTEVMCDRQLVNLLLLLIGKSTNTQAVFGRGNDSGGQGGVKPSGTMDTKGLFWGNQDGISGVKVFGIEHYWGNIWRRVAGWINANGTQKVKMTYGQSDGSTVDGYNFDGNGYVTIPDATPSGSIGGYITKMKFHPFGLIPYVTNGSATTHYCDGLWMNNGQNNYALVGGISNDGLRAGAFFSSLDTGTGVAFWAYSAALSCKPLARNGELAA